MEACPVCDLILSVEELPAHVEAHFASPTQNASNAVAASAAASPEALDSIQCAICGQSIPLVDIDSHEAAHALESEQPGASGHSFDGTSHGSEFGGSSDDDAARRRRENREAQEFEALKQRYGFSDKVGCLHSALQLSCRSGVACPAQLSEE